MRVKQPIEAPVWVEIRGGDKLISRKGEPYVRPGEMVTIVLASKYYDEVRQLGALSLAVVGR